MVLFEQRLHLEKAYITARDFIIELCGCSSVQYKCTNLPEQVQ